MKSNDPEQSIHATLCWFTAMAYPVTAFEVWKWLLAPKQAHSLETVENVLRTSGWLKKRIENKHGFYTVKHDRSIDELVEIRRRRFCDATRKYKRLKRACRYLARVPGVCGIAAANTLAWWHTRPESDIDLLIFVRDGRLWTARMFAVLPFAFMGWRPGRREGQKDPFCFSFFLNQSRLSLEHIAIHEGDDPYLAYWIRSLVPVVDKNGVFSRFISENEWVDAVLPNACAGERHRDLQAGRLAGSFPGVLPDRWFEALQRRRMPEHLHMLAQKDDHRVVIDETMLKFHENDRRRQFKKEWEALIEQTG